MISKDIDRLKYTFSKGNKINQNDIEALNGFIEYVNKEKERELNNHHLFAKLYVNAFKDILIRSEGNYQLASKSLLGVVRIDLNDHLDRLIIECNQIWLEKEIKTNDSLNVEYPNYDKEQMKNRIVELISNLIEDFG